MTTFNDTTARTYTMKYVYAQKFIDYLSKATPLSTRLQRVSPTRKDPSGKGWVFDIEYGRNGGVGARAETTTAANVTLPPAGSRTDRNITYYMKAVYGRTNWSGWTLNALSSNTSSFDGTGKGHTMQALMEDVSRDVNRMMWGTGFGHKAMVSTASTGAIETVFTDSATNYAYGYNACRGADWLWPGLFTDIVDFAAGTSMTLEGADEAGGKLSAVTSSTATMTTDPGFTEAAGDFIINYGAISASTVTAPTVNEPFGLAAICSETDPDDVISYSGSTGVTTGTTLGGLDISTYPWWAGNIIYNGTTTSKYQTPQTLSLYSMQKAYYASTQKKNNKEGAIPTAGYCRWPLLFAYGDVCLQMKAINDTMDLDGGWFNLTFNGMPIIADNDGEHGKMYFVHEPDIHIFEPKPLGWLDFGDGVTKQIANYDAAEAAVVWYFNIGCMDRSLHTILWNCDEWS